MENQTDYVKIGTMLGLFAVAIGLTMNTCAMDRLEQQVIATRKAVEQGGGGGGGPVVVAPTPGKTKGAPGEGTGAIATGWNGAQAEILFVSDAKPGAPFTLDQKPRPQGDAYVTRYSGTPGTLNYYATNDGVTSRIAKNSLDSMMQLDIREPTRVIPSLATSWEVGEDKLTYTYHLRKGVRFADGRPFTADDVVFSFETMRDPAVNAEHLRGGFEEIESLEARDDHTIVIKYRNKDWRGLYGVGLDLRVLNKGWYEEQIPVYAKKLDIDEFGTEPGTPGFGDVFNKIRVPCPGTGPYFMNETEFDPSNGIKMVQNPFWWGIQVHPEWYNLAELRWIFIDDEVAAFEEFKKGTFDVMVIDAREWDNQYSTDEQLNSVANFYTYDHTGLGFSYVAWNNRRPPFDDARVRRAMAHMIDREWIKEEVNAGRARVGDCFGKLTYDICKQNAEPLVHDMEKAKALLAEAGWTDSDGDGILDKDGKRFEFELKVGSPRPYYTMVGGLITDSAAKLGIRATMRTIEWSTFLEDYMTDNFDATILFTSFPDPFIDPKESNHSSQDIPRGGNRPGWHNDEADQLMEGMIEEFDAKKRLEMYWKFNEIYRSEQPRTHLNYGLVSVLQNKRFEDVEVLPSGLRNNEYWVKPENVKYK